MSDDFDDNDKGNKKGSSSSGGVIIPFPSNMDGYVVKTIEKNKDNISSDIIDPIDIEQERKDRQDFIEKDSLVKAVKSGDISIMIDEILNQIAEESAILKFERERCLSFGKSPIPQITNRIISLRQLVETIIKRQENARADQLDLSSERFKKVLHLWMQFVYDSMVKSGVSVETIDVVFRQIQADMIDWEKKIVDLESLCPFVKKNSRANLLTKSVTLLIT